METGLTKKNKNLLNALKKKYSTDTDLAVLVDTFLERTDGLSQVFAKGLLESAKLTRGTAKGVVKSKLQAILAQIEPALVPMTPAEPPPMTPTEMPMTPPNEPQGVGGVGGGAGAGASDVPNEPLGGGVGGEMGFSDRTLAELNTLREKLNQFKPNLKGSTAKTDVLNFLKEDRKSVV